jgi:hypothetical protein
VPRLSLVSIPSRGTGYAERVIERCGKLAPRAAVINDAEQIRSFIEAEVPPPPAIGLSKAQKERSRIFNTLVKEGEAVQERTGKVWPASCTPGVCRRRRISTRSLTV